MSFTTAVEKVDSGQEAKNKLERLALRWLKYKEAQIKNAQNLEQMSKIDYWIPDNTNLNGKAFYKIIELTEKEGMQVLKKYFNSRIVKAVLEYMKKGEE